MTDHPGMGFRASHPLDPRLPEGSVMKLLAGLCASLLLVFSSVGCCCMSSCVSSCDPCGRELCDGLGSGCGKCSSGCGLGGCGLGSCLSRLFHGHCHKCSGMYAGHGWDAYTGFGDGCSGGGCGMASPADCACGQPHGMPNYLSPSVPPNQQPPAPIPGADPMSARQAAPRMPVSHAAAPATQAAPQMAPQQVSYEEFQRLPGVITSAPTAVATPTVPPVTSQTASWSAAK
jgi:hypothetical protein